MRYGYDDADLDDVIRILKLPALKSPSRSGPNFVHSSAQVLRSWLAPVTIAPGLQNEASGKRSPMRVSLFKRHFATVCDRPCSSGPDTPRGGVFDADSPAAEAFALLNRLDPALDSLWETGHRTRAFRFAAVRRRLTAA